MPLNLGDPIQDDPGTIWDYSASTGESAYAAGRRAYDSSGFVYGAYNAMRGQIDYDWGTRVSKQDALTRVGQLGISVDVPDEGISKYKLDTMIWYKARQMQDQMYMNRSAGGVATGAAEFGAGLLGSLGDPVSLGANFIPVVREARYAMALEKAGASALARTAVRAKYGAIEGAVGATLVEPLMIAHNKWSQLDYTAMDSFMNVTFGTVAGGGLHSIGGYAFDKFGISVSRMRDLAPLVDENTKLKILQEYVKAAELGNPEPDALKIMMREFAEGHEQWRSKSASTDIEAANRSLDFDDIEIDRARADIELAAFPPEDAYTGRTLFAQLALDGGIKVRDADGNITREGAEILALVRDTKYPGLINNVHGAPPEYIRERLTEDGWFGSGRQTTETGLDELYDLLDTAARGDVRHPEFADAQRANKQKTREIEAITRELQESGIPVYDAPDVRARKLAAYRASKVRERIANDPDFDPEELLWRDPSEPMTQEESNARFGEDDDSRPYSFAEEARVREADAVQKEVDDFRAGDEEQQIADDLLSLNGIVSSLKARDLWTKAEDDLLEAAKADKELAAHLEQVYKAAAACELQ